MLVAADTPCTYECPSEGVGVPGVKNPEGKTSRGGEVEGDRTCLTCVEIGGFRGIAGGKHIVVISSCFQATLVDHLYPSPSFLLSSRPSGRRCLAPSEKPKHFNK